MQVYNDFKADTGVKFELNPAVRTPTGSCIEESNCNWEKITLCAFNTTNVAGRVGFLACMDEADSSEAPAAAKVCATKVDLDYSTISTCYTGAAGSSLLEAASAVYNKQFPGSTYVPHVFVNDEEFVGGGDKPAPSYAVIKKALCAAGSSAAVCKSLSSCLA